MKRMTAAEVKRLVKSLDDRTLSHLIAEASAEDRRRFDERCAERRENRGR